MKIQFKIIAGMIVWAHFVIAITWALAKFHDGLSIGFLLLWAAVLFFGLAGLCLNWDETGRWWERREEEKSRRQEPPKGDWKG